MTRTSSGALILAVTALMAIPTGCGIDEYYTSLGTSALPGDHLYNDAVDGAAEGSCGLESTVAPSLLDLVDLTGKAFRFATLALTKPLPDELNSTVSSVIDPMIADGTFNLVVAIDADDRTGLTLDGRIGSAVKTDDTLALGDDAQTLAALWANATTARFDSTEEGVPFVLFIDMGDESLNVSLPIENLRLSGILNDTGTDITAGQMNGALTMKAAQETLVMGMSIASFLDGSAPLMAADPAVQPDLDMNGDGTLDAFSFQGCFTAKIVDLAD